MKIEAMLLTQEQIYWQSLGNVCHINISQLECMQFDAGWRKASLSKYFPPVPIAPLPPSPVLLVELRVFGSI